MIKCKSWYWNESIERAFVLPVCHGTDFFVAWKIASVGFANLSSTDPGFFGKGIYFSTSASYCVPFFTNAKCPALIICFAIPGNPYPVYENPKDEKNIVGQDIMGGHQSHYAVTNAEALAFSLSDWTSTRKRYDELVIPQEAQIVPLFLLKIDMSNREVLFHIMTENLEEPEQEEGIIYDRPYDHNEYHEYVDSEMKDKKSYKKSDEVTSLLDIFKDARTSNE